MYSFNEHLSLAEIGSDLVSFEPMFRSSAFHFFTVLAEELAFWSNLRPNFSATLH